VFIENDRAKATAPLTNPPYQIIAISLFPILIFLLQSVKKVGNATAMTLTIQRDMIVA